MKQKKERQFDRRSKRRDQDDLIEQYKPPSKSTPQLAAFARIDKCESIVGAQLLADSAIPESRNQAYDGKPATGAGRGKGGKGYRTTDRPIPGRGKGLKGAKGGKGKGDRKPQ